MPITIRRVVTGHTEEGKATVMIDEVATGSVESRPGAIPLTIWTTEGFPVSNDGHDDESRRKTRTAHANGTVFRVISFGPGVQPLNHRTDSIDYGIVLSGEIVIDLDGDEVTLRAGDVLVQRGTIHNWINRGTAPCVMAFVLIAAKSVNVGGKILNATI